MRSPLLLSGLTSVLASLAASGCIQQSEERPDAEAASSSATALVVVERTTGPGDAVRGDAVIARFVRVREGRVDDQALRLAGATWDLPAVGTCATGQDREAPQPALQPRAVDLLDVGSLTLGGLDGASATKNTVLMPRSMPDPTGVVSGVFYSARSTEAFTASERLQLRTSGGADLAEGFSVSVASPRDVSDVRVAFATSGLDVTWDAAESDDARDVVYVDVLGAAGNLVSRCTTLDVGKVAVSLPSVAVLDEGQVAVHRLHRESFRAKSIEPGEIRFDVARVVAFRR